MTVLSFFGFYILFATRFRCWLATLFKSGALSEKKGNDEIMSKKSSVMSLLLKLHIHTHLNKCTHVKFVCNDSYVTSGLLLSSFSIRSLSLLFLLVWNGKCFSHFNFLRFSIISRWGYGTLPTKYVSVNRIFNLALPCKMVFFFVLSLCCSPPAGSSKRMMR